MEWFTTVGICVCITAGAGVVVQPDTEREESIEWRKYESDCVNMISLVLSRILFLFLCINFLKQLAKIKRGATGL